MQFDMFGSDAPAKPPEAPPARLRARPKGEPAPTPPQPDGAFPTLRPHIPQPPVFVREGEEVPAHPLGLKPLRMIPAGWTETIITVDQIKAERLLQPATATDSYITLVLLKRAGVMMRLHLDDIHVAEPYGSLAGPYMARRSWGARWGDEDSYAMVVLQSPNAVKELISAES